jgi:hypothetical protein
MATLLQYDVCSGFAVPDGFGRNSGAVDSCFPRHRPPTAERQTKPCIVIRAPGVMIVSQGTYSKGIVMIRQSASFLRNVVAQAYMGTRHQQCTVSAHRNYIAVSRALCANRLLSLHSGAPRDTLLQPLAAPEALFSTLPQSPTHSHHSPSAVSGCCSVIMLLSRLPPYQGHACVLF